MIKKAINIIIKHKIESTSPIESYYQKKSSNVEIIKISRRKKPNTMIIVKPKMNNFHLTFKSSTDQIHVKNYSESHDKIKNNKNLNFIEKYEFQNKNDVQNQLSLKSFIDQIIPRKNTSIEKEISFHEEHQKYADFLKTHIDSNQKNKNSPITNSNSIGFFKNQKSVEKVSPTKNKNLGLNNLSNDDNKTIILPKLKGNNKKTKNLVILDFLKKKENLISSRRNIYKMISQALKSDEREYEALIGENMKTSDSNLRILKNIFKNLDGRDTDFEKWMVKESIPDLKKQGLIRLC